MKLPLAALALSALALPACTKAPDPAPPADEYVHEEIQQLKQRLQEFEAWAKTPNTTGLETADLGRRILQYEQRFKSLEEQLAAATKTGTSSAEPTSAGSPSRPVEMPSVVPVDASDYSTQQVADFRRILDVVEKQKRDEQQAERIKTQLTRLSVDLTPDQEKAVTALTLALQQKRGEIVRGGFGTNEVDRKTTQEKIEVARAQWESDIRSVVPTAAADKIVEGMGGGFGGGPRRIDATTGRNGMGN